MCDVSCCNYILHIAVSGVKNLSKKVKQGTEVRGRNEKERENGWSEAWGGEEWEEGPFHIEHWPDHLLPSPPLPSPLVTSDAYLYCRFGVLLKTDWDTMQQQDLNTLEHQENVCFSSLLSAGGPEIIEL